MSMNAEETFAILITDPDVAASPLAKLCGEAIADQNRLHRRLERISRISDGYQGDLMRTNRDLAAANERLGNALNDVRTLSGFIPVCSRCNKVRDDGGYWDSVESWLGKHSDAVTASAVCPDCLAGNCAHGAASPTSVAVGDEAEAEAGHLAAIMADPAFSGSPLLGEYERLSTGFQKLSRRLNKISRISDGFQAQLKELNVALAQASRTDPLTSLANRRAMLERLEHVNTTDDAPLFAIAMIDIDHFKRINDSFGHAIGDGILRALADTLRANVRGVDFVARWGGEEFLLFFAESDPAKVQTLCERIREAAETVQVDCNGKRIGCSVSIGCAVHEKMLSFEDTIRDADRALYAAKSHGRNTVVLAADL
jgi:diguanylate cyclase (GGDEF)-like protein